jgi:hypothetical protein
LKIKYFVGFVGAFLLFAGQAGAASIPVPSFDEPILGPGGYTSNTCPSGWNCSGSQGFFGGVYKPTSAQFTPGADGISGITPDGNGVAYIYGLVPVQLSIYDGLGTIAANTIYTLSVWAGARADQVPDAWQGFTAWIQMLAGQSVVASEAVPDPGLGNWENVALSWGSNTSPADIGENLAIRLYWTSNGASTNSQLAWSDVTLNADTGSDPATTPLPGAACLFGSALAGAVAVSRWQRKKASV